MLNTNLTQTEINDYYSQIMEEFEPVDGFKKEDYYGVASMSIKKNDHVQIRLMYDYDKHPVNGNPLDIDDADDALLISWILMSKRKSKTPYKKFKFSRTTNKTSGSDTPTTSSTGF